MKKDIYLLLLLIFFGIEISYSQTAVQTQNVSLKPSGNADGLVGNMTIKYAFNNCFGDAFMGYGYTNLSVDYLLYEDEKYYPSDLGISSFNQYIILAKGNVELYKISDESKILIKSKYLNRLDQNNDFGCYSIGVNIGSDEKENINNLRAEFKNISLSYQSSLTSKVKSIFLQKQNENKYRKLMLQVDGTLDLNKKIELLKNAKKYTGNKNEIDQKIQDLENAIDQNEKIKELKLLENQYDYAEDKNEKIKILYKMKEYSTSPQIIIINEEISKLNHEIKEEIQEKKKLEEEEKKKLEVEEKLKLEEDEKKKLEEEIRKKEIEDQQNQLAKEKEERRLAEFERERVRKEEELRNKKTPEEKRKEAELQAQIEAMKNRYRMQARTALSEGDYQKAISLYQAAGDHDQAKSLYPEAAKNYESRGEYKLAAKYYSLLGNNKKYRENSEYATNKEITQNFLDAGWGVGFMYEQFADYISYGLHGIYEANDWFSIGMKVSTGQFSSLGAEIGLGIPFINGEGFSMWFTGGYDYGTSELFNSSDLEAEYVFVDSSEIPPLPEKPQYTGGRYFYGIRLDFGSIGLKGALFQETPQELINHENSDSDLDERLNFQIGLTYFLDK